MFDITSDVYSSYECVQIIVEYMKVLRTMSFLQLTVLSYQPSLSSGSSRCVARGEMVGRRESFGSWIGDFLG